MALRGASNHIRRLQRLAGPGLNRLAAQVLLAGGQKIQIEAQISITRGAVSGKNHVPSKPNEPPNEDSGVLGNGIETTLVRSTGDVIVEVSSNAPYASYLEFGTSRMAARPYLRPARDKMRPEIEALFAKAVSKLAGESGR